MTYKEWCIGQSLRRFPRQSWYRFYSKRGYNKIIRANYFAKHDRGIPLDVQAMDISEEFYGRDGYVTPEDIVDFVLEYVKNPFTRKVKPEYDEW